MRMVSDLLSNIAPEMSYQMAASLGVGGLTLSYYGHRQWCNAQTTSDKMKAAGCLAVGVGMAGLGALSALSQTWQTYYPTTQTLATNACRNFLEQGHRADPSFFKELDHFFPSMVEGVHYQKLGGAFDETLYCWANLTTAGKELLNKNTLRVHTQILAPFFSVFSVIVKLNLY